MILEASDFKIKVNANKKKKKKCGKHGKEFIKMR